MDEKSNGSTDNAIQPSQNVPSKKSWTSTWTWFVLFLVILGALLILWRYVKTNSPSTETPATDNQSTGSTTKTTAVESWTREAAVVSVNTTSTDTHKISDNLYRMYKNGQGAIFYTESTDGKNWQTAVSTGVTEDNGKFMSNPAALKVADSSWIMLYEQAPITRPGQKQGAPGTANQRNLYLATSTDGKAFAKAGLAIDSSIADNYFASVPDLILLSNNTIRLYYVCGGDSICSRLSTDNGKTWTKEAGFRLTNSAVDPDVVTKTTGGVTKWLMYYSVLDPAKNGLYKATSADGLTWTTLDNQVVTKTGTNAIVDPDVFETSSGNWLMYFGESGGNSSVSGDQINLYRASFSGNIFGQ